MQAIRYRTGFDERTGRLLVGRAHLAQSLLRIWRTRIDTLPMALDFGSDLRKHLGEDITPALALSLYDTLVTPVHTYEPECRIRQLQVVKLERDGALGIKHGSDYYPEGRLGNYAIVEEFASVVPLTEVLARRQAA